MTDEEKRDLLVRLAEGVMGWEPGPKRRDSIEYWSKRPDGSTVYLFLHSPDSGYIELHEGWNPLENIADAWMIVGALVARGYTVTCVSCPKTPLSDMPAECELYRDGHSDGSEAETAPLAICKAALAVLQNINQPTQRRLNAIT